jgi:hypothetical protein
MSSFTELGFDLLPEVGAIIAQESSKDFFQEPDSPIIIEKRKIAPWGDSNNLPGEVMDMIERSEVVGTNNHFNILMAYGQGVKPVIKRNENGKTVFEDCNDTRVKAFFEDNDIPGYFLEQCSDMCTFSNVFPEIILTKSLKEIFSLRHKEAVYSRYGVADPSTGNIIYHYYSAKWKDGITSVDDMVTSEVLNKYNPLRDLENRIIKRNYVTPRFIIPVNFPTPGKVYYSRPPFWSIFRSGSYDFSTMIWEFKKALLKNGLKIKYIIYVSDKYWDNIFKEEKIDVNNPAAVKARKETELQKFKDFIAADKSSGKGLMVLKKTIASGSSAIEEKYITIEVIKADLKGGEFLEDSSEVSNMISYAMSVHPNLIGSAPGKSGGAMSGTDKRELFMIKSALMKPYRDRLLRPLYLVKKFNKWPEDLEFIVPDFEFTTLDKNKKGKQEVVQNSTKAQE